MLGNSTWGPLCPYALGNTIQPEKPLSSGYWSVHETNHASYWIVIYPVNSVIHLSNNPHHDVIIVFKTITLLANKRNKKRYFCQTTKMCWYHYTRESSIFRTVLILFFLIFASCFYCPWLECKWDWFCSVYWASEITFLYKEFLANERHISCPSWKPHPPWPTTPGEILLRLLDFFGLFIFFVSLFRFLFPDSAYDVNWF